MPAYLADTSIWAWAGKRSRPDIKQKLEERFARDEIVTTPPVVLEVLHRARRGPEYEELLLTIFGPVRWLPLTESAGERAVQVQRELARTTHGNHLRPAVDFLIAAAAEASGAEVVLWFFDKDLRVICEHTGQLHEAESALSH